MILSALLQKATAFVLTALVVALLLVAWILTAPLLRWGVEFGDWYHHLGHPEKEFDSRTPKRLV